VLYAQFSSDGLPNSSLIQRSRNRKLLRGLPHEHIFRLRSMGAHVYTDAKYERYRNSPKGIAAATRRNAGLCAQRAARRAYHAARKNQFRSIGFDGKYGGPIPDGLPRIGELKLSNFKPSV
jgi:hypothetical protein